MSERIILDIKAEILRLLDKTLTECEKIMVEQGCDLHEAVRIKMQEKKLHKCPPPGFSCENCGYVDYSIMYASDPPQYKCERYGHLVRITDECKKRGELMFDIIDFALENNVAIVIDPYTENGLCITVGTGVLTAEDSTTVHCGFHLETEPEKAQEACERILGMIREKNASLSDYLTHSKKRAEMEKFWKESIPIMGRE